MKKFYIITLLILLFTELSAQNFNIKGTVISKDTKLPLAGANIKIVGLNIGVSTDINGGFILSVPSGNYTVEVSFVGYSPYSQVLEVSSDLFVIIELSKNDFELKEVVVTDAKHSQNIENSNTGMLKLSMQDIKKIPVFMGDYDPIKALRLTPGVQAGGEGNAGIFIRGGAPGQNLVLLEDMPIYNASHLIGLFSVFNPGIVKSVTLYKGLYSTAYGGRASSMMKIGLNDGVSEKPEFEGSIGLISSRLNAKIPMLNKKASLLLGGRVTYLDIYQPFFNILKFKNIDLQDNKFGFYDLNARFELKISNKNKIVINSYTGLDQYKLLHSSIGLTNNMNWGNKAATLKWIHLFNSNSSLSNTFGVTTCFFNLNAGYQMYNIKLKSGLIDPFFRSEVMISLANHFIHFGVEANLHLIQPESVNIKVDNSNYNSKMLYRASETSLFINDTYKINSSISVILGLRATSYIHLGPYDRYVSNVQGVVLDTISYKTNSIVKRYFVIEPRLALSYKQSEDISYKISLTRNYQFIHLISVGTVSLPTDIWFPSTLLVKPEYADQFTIGYFRNFNNNRYESSFELYFKRLNNIIEFKNSMINKFKYNEFEESISHGKGYSFGAEWYVRKNFGVLTGGISYTLAWAIRKFNDINEGEFFFGKYDRRHELALSLQYQLSQKWSLSSVFIYSTGNAMTLPAGRYMIQGNIVNDYTSVNSFRMPAYQRLDLSATHTTKIKNKYESSWNFSLYNAYNRANPYYVYFEAQGSLDEYKLSVKAKKISLFPVLPSVSWTFKF